MPRILAAALWKRLTQGQIDPCYLFFGEETYRPMPDLQASYMTPY